MKSLAITLTTCLLCGIQAFTQNLYDLNTIQKIEIYFTQSNWDYQMDTAKSGAEGYTIARWVKVNGVQFDSVGVKYKGNSSYNANQKKNPFHIELDQVLDQSYQGITDFKLSNCFSDPSMIREALAYQILSNYMDCPRANFTQVYINNELIGLYTNVESISKKFVASHYYSSKNTFFKCTPPGGAGQGSGKSNLKYISEDSSRYYSAYELKSKAGWKDLIELSDTVTNNPAGLSKIMDVDKAIWMLAFNNLLVNLDSYSGTFCQNYYLYKDNTGHFNPTIWDLNMSFAGFTQTGGSGSLSSNQQKQQLTTTLHINDADWPLIKDILNDPTYRKMYFAHMRTMNKEMFVSGQYQTMAASIQAVIDTAVQSDPNKFYTYTQFKNGMTQNVSGGMGGGVIAIGTLMQGRSTYLATTADFQYTQPEITEVTVRNSNPAIGDTINVTAMVSNASSSSVYLGVRQAVSDKFVRVPMYDDGLHDDGAANDQVYGASFVLGQSQAHYYIYAENANAARFSPERAEFEFHSVNVTLTTANPGDIVINEFMAVNQTDTVDEQSKHEDWLELYNNTSSPISMAGLYLSDDYADPYKWEFPASVVIPANGFLFIWADSDSSSIGYHADFKLSSNGEMLILSYKNGTVLDSLRFGAQTADISESRCPDGTGSFRATASSTPGYHNDCILTSVKADTKTVGIQVYPNPASSSITLKHNSSTSTGTFKVFDMKGSLLLTEKISQPETSIPVTTLPAGLYFYQFSSDGNNDVLFGKLSVQH